MKYSELEHYHGQVEEYLAQVLFPALDRSQQRKWGGVYFRGLLLEGERKSAGAMAERLPDGNEQAMQQFITDSPWDLRAPRRRQAQFLEPLLGPRGVWVIDDTTFLKKGNHSVGVAQQYSGRVGGAANCQAAVSLHLSTPRGSLPLDFELYLPEEWTDDRARRRKVGIPGEVVYQTKWQLGLGLIDRARRWQLQDQVVAADAAYGNVVGFRDGLAKRRLSYVVGVNSTTAVWAGEVPAYLPPRRLGRRGRPRTRWVYDEAARPLSVREAALQLPGEAWCEVTWEQGSKGPLCSRFAAIRVQPAHGHVQKTPPRAGEWLLMEWHKGEAEPTDFWFSNLPETTALAELVGLAKMRWHVEQDYQQLKEELGLDHFEGRKWVGWHHHVTMTMLAFGFLLWQRLQGEKRGST